MTTPPAISHAISTIRNELAHHRLIIVAGTGVTAAATGGSALASWTGLIDNGIDRILSAGLRPADWADRARADVSSGYLEDLVIAAEKVTGALGGINHPTYRSWLRDTAGTLSATDTAVPDAIAHLGAEGAVITTTNYDDILENATRWNAATWRDPSAVTAVLREEEEGVIHLHGHWRDPASVVFGSTTYAHVMLDEPAMQFLRTTVYASTIVFVGVGEGVNDPNFTALRHWMRTVTASAPQQNYHLVTDAQAAALRYYPAERITPVAFGPRHADLVPFLNTLRSGSSVVRGLRGLIVPAAPAQEPREQDADVVALPLRRNPPTDEQLKLFTQFATRLDTVDAIVNEPDEPLAVAAAGGGARLAQYRTFARRFAGELDTVAAAYRIRAQADRDALERAIAWSGHLVGILDAALDPELPSPPSSPRPPSN